MVVAEDLESEQGRSAAGRIAVELRDNFACKMMCDDNVAPVDFVDIRELCARQEAKTKWSARDKTEIVLKPLSCVMEHGKGIKYH